MSHITEDIMSSTDDESNDEQSIAYNDISDTALHKSVLAPPKSASGYTFVSRVYLAIGGRYIVNMRRSVQTVALYEANRCLSSQYGHLRPFQRKAALLDTAKDLVESLSFIPISQRIEIMFRTAKGRLPLSPELAWRRMKLIGRYIRKTIVPKIPKIIEGCKNHDELCRKFLQLEYTEHSGKINQYHEIWEYTHINYCLAFRMYYIGHTINLDMPPARDPNPDRVVPSDRPSRIKNRRQSNSAGERQKPKDERKAISVACLDLDYIVNSSEDLMARTKERRAILKEVKDHMELLKEFEGLVSNKELEKQKKGLFMSLPPIPAIRFD